jgi:hypothetical protein
MFRHATEARPSSAFHHAVVEPRSLCCYDTMNSLFILAHRSRILELSELAVTHCLMMVILFTPQSHARVDPLAVEDSMQDSVIAKAKNIIIKQGYGL